MSVIPRSVTIGVLVVTALACGNPTKSSTKYSPTLPTQWAAAVTNSYFPLVPGSVWEYRGETDEGTETNRVEVLSETQVVHGVTAAVVWDRVYLDDELIEETRDWYAQDAEGNVWYLGEDSKEIEGGVVVSTDGSWEWGVDDALPGVLMWANPAAHRGAEYRQEFYEDEAEDWGKVVTVNQAVDVPAGHYAGCVQTDDWSGLESGTLEKKYYAPAVGLVLEIEASGTRIELISFTQP